MKVKVSLELAENRGWIPEVDSFLPNGKWKPESVYRRELQSRDKKYEVDANFNVEVELQEPAGHERG